MEDIRTSHWQIGKLFISFYIIYLIKKLLLNKVMHTYDWCIAGLVQYHAMITLECLINMKTLVI